MNRLLGEIIKRTITSLVGGVLFFGAFFLSNQLFNFLLLFVALEILIFEWPKLFDYKNVYFWLIFPIYPLTPIFLLIYTNQLFYFSNKFLALYPYLAAWSCDFGAYVVGSAFGYHKITSISPNKSWEGLLGGFFTLLFFNLFFFGASWKILGVSASLTLLAFCGDLLKSILKRRAKIKDTGVILPGHGGFLDRFDSVFFVVVGFLFFYFYTLFS